MGWSQKGLAMAELKFYKKSRTNWTPASYTVDETTGLYPVVAGDLVGPCFSYVRVAFDGTGGRTFSLGDDGDVDRFMATTDADITTVANFVQGLGGASSTYLALGRHLYIAANNIDIVFVAATAGSPTVGSIDLWHYQAKINPR